MEISRRDFLKVATVTGAMLAIDQYTVSGKSNLKEFPLTKTVPAGGEKKSQLLATWRKYKTVYEKN